MLKRTVGLVDEDGMRSVEKGRSTKEEAKKEATRRWLFVRESVNDWALCKLA